MSVTCADCTLDFFEGAEACPHCGRPSRFPNVVRAQAPAEVDALEERYRTARRAAIDRGLAAEVDTLEREMARSEAVIARFPAEVERLAFSDRELYATYYEALDGGLRHPKGERWDILRAAADEAFFPRYRERIRFGALSLDRRGTRSYGECFLVAREDMVAHRTSVFEENTVMFLVRRHVDFGTLDALPQGHRADWASRGKLAVVKHAGHLAAGDGAPEIAARVLVDGTSEEDVFIEAHICGPMTIRSFAMVIWCGIPPRGVKFRTLASRLRRYGVALEAR